MVQLGNFCSPQNYAIGKSNGYRQVQWLSAATCDAQHSLIACALIYLLDSCGIFERGESEASSEHCLGLNILILCRLLLLLLSFLTGFFFSPPCLQGGVQQQRPLERAALWPSSHVLFPFC